MSRLPHPGATYSQSDMIVLLQSVDQRLADLERIIADRYTVTNGTDQRALDVTAATLPDVARVLGTLLSDLKLAGKLG